MRDIHYKPIAVSIVTTTVLAGLAMGAVIQGTGRMVAVAIMYGQDSVLAGWILIFALSFVGSTVFALLYTLLVPERYLRSPIVGSVLGLAFGLVAWFLAIAMFLPIWMEATLDLVRPIPYVHPPTLIALTLFGLLLGMGFPLSLRLFESMEHESSLRARRQ